MDEFDRRRKGFDKFFALSEALRFKALSRRNRAVGEWAAEKLAFTGEAAERYAEAFGKVQIEGETDETLIARLHDDGVFALQPLAQRLGDLHFNRPRNVRPFARRASRAPVEWRKSLEADGHEAAERDWCGRRGSNPHDL